MRINKLPPISALRRIVPSVGELKQRLCYGALTAAERAVMEIAICGTPPRVDVTQCEAGRTMLQGGWYHFGDPTLVQARARAQYLYGWYNRTSDEQTDVRWRILQALLGGIGEGSGIRPPFRCDYGLNIVLGDGVDINFGLVCLDCGPVTIGDRTLIAPGVHLYTVGHSLDPAHRARGLERIRPIVIGKDVWIGGGVIVLPGVTIGDGSFVGPGSLVREDIPTYVYAEGNPCRVIRNIESRRNLMK